VVVLRGKRPYLSSAEWSLALYNSKHCQLVDFLNGTWKDLDRKSAIRYCSVGSERLDRQTAILFSSFIIEQDELGLMH